jgi:hypothetical protein
MIRNRPPQDASLSNLSLNNLVNARTVVARQELRTTNLLTFDNAAFGVSANGNGILAVAPTDTNTLVVLTNLKLAPGRRLSVGDLTVGSVLAEDIECNTLTATDTVTANFLAINNTATIESLDASDVSSQSVLSDAITVTSGSAVLDSLMVSSPFYISSDENVAAIWRLSIDPISGNLEFQNAPDWTTRLSIPSS